MFAASLSACAEAQDIQLPKPDLSEKSLSMVETLNTRHSVRSFDTKELSLQQMSNLCWAAMGVTRDNDHRTSPTARNLKEIRLFAFTKDAVYEYLPVENMLKFMAEGDHRNLVAKGQDFVLDAPVSLVAVIDFERFGGMTGDHALMMASVDGGNVSQNINLYCQSVGLATVPRGTMDSDGIKTLLGLGDQQKPVMNNPVGFEKK